MERQRRLLTSARVAQVLGKAGIPARGANKLIKVSRTGNMHVRVNQDQSSTAVRIFNVQAFRGTAEQAAAVAAWKEGTKLEKANDLEGAQEYYKEAYNQLMSFSVLEENAAEFAEAFEVSGIVEDVPAGADLQLAGTKTVLGFNRPRPVAVTTNMSSSAAMFVEDEEPETKAAPTPKAKSKIK